MVKMKNLGSEVSQSMVLTRVLCSLPKTYRHFHSAWDSETNERKTLENLTARLMKEESIMCGYESIWKINPLH